MKNQLARFTLSVILPVGFFLVLIRTITPKPSLAFDTSNIYWEENFENLSQAPSYPNPSPFDYIEQGNGSYYYPDRCVIALENGIVKHGSTSLKLAQTQNSSDIPYNERRSRVEIHWDKHIASDESWRSFWLYVPSDFRKKSWISVSEYKEEWNNPYDYAKWYLTFEESGVRSE